MTNFKDNIEKIQTGTPCNNLLFKKGIMVYYFTPLAARLHFTLLKKKNSNFINKVVKTPYL